MARAAAVSAIAVCGVLYAQAINIKPGPCEIVTTLTVNLPPGYQDTLQQPRTQQLCVTGPDLKQVSQKLAQARTGKDPSCKLSDDSVAGDKVKFVMSCQGSTTHFEGTFLGTSFEAH